MAYDLVETDQTGCSLSITPAFEGDMLTSVISLLTGQVTPNWCHPCIWRQYTRITELVLTKLSSPRTNVRANHIRTVILVTPDYSFLCPSKCLHLREYAKLASPRTEHHFIPRGRILTPNYSFLCPSKSHWNRPNWSKKKAICLNWHQTGVMMNCLNTITFW